MASPDATRPQGRQDVVFRQLDQEWVIFDPAVHRLHALNLSAALVWEHCDGERTVEDITGVLAESFGSDASHVAGDVERAVQRFADEGLFA